MYWCRCSTWKHVDDPDTLLAQEIPDLNACAFLSDVGIDGEMGVYKPHLVFKALCHTLDHVLQVPRNTLDNTSNFVCLSQNPLLAHQLLTEAAAEIDMHF